MESENMLGVLLTMTEQQSQITEHLLGQLQEQIVILDHTTQATQSAASLVEQSAALVEQAVQHATPALQKAVSEAVNAAMKVALVRASETAVMALEQASKPMLNKLSGVAAAVSDAEGQLKRATASFGWKWAMVAGGTLVGTLAVFIVVAWLTILWQRKQVDSLVEQKTELKEEVAQLQEQADVLARKGGRIKLSKCGEDNRLCIEIASYQGDAIGQKDFKGSWRSKEGQQFVVPKGY